MQIQYNQNKILEANTLETLYNYCKNNLDAKVLYFHSKGLTHKNNLHDDEVTNAWRIYLEYFVIHDWKKCIKDLNEYECVGAEWIGDFKLPDFENQGYVHGFAPHYSGNFWWSKASYIQKLDLEYIYNEENGWGRWKSELWIGTKNPQYKSYHNSNKVLYNCYYSPNFYINEKNDEK